MLSEHNIQKYSPETIKTTKGHLNQRRKSVWSTKAKGVPLETCNTSHLHGKKVCNMCTQMYMVRKNMFSNQTGQFPTRSLQGNKYIMVMVGINRNAILVKPMKNCKDGKMIRAYKALLLQLKQAGIVRKEHVFDNDIQNVFLINYPINYKILLQNRMMGDPHVKVKLRGRHDFCLSFLFSDRAAAQSDDILDQISMPSNLPVVQLTIAQHGQGDRRARSSLIRPNYPLTEKYFSAVSVKVPILESSAADCADLSDADHTC
jgi:hypothetical protein